MKIGILTYHSSHNYGAFLQAYALCNALSEKTGNEVEIINFSMEKAENMYKEIAEGKGFSIEKKKYLRDRAKMFETSSLKYHKLSGERFSTDDIADFAKWIHGRYDAIVAGSDEIWVLNGFRGFPNPYWLPDVCNCQKLSYAASSRTEPTEVTDDIRLKLYEYLQSFGYIGVRDQVTKELIENIIGKDERVHLNCDPTFAYDFHTSKEIGKQLIKDKFGIKDNRKCIALMIHNVELARNIIKTYSKDFNFISLYDYHHGTKGFAVLDPFEWIQAIAGADGLITNYFHGMVFAIKNNTPFIIFESRTISNIRYSKSYDLLKRNGLEKHFFMSANAKEQSLREVGTFLADIISGKAESDFQVVCENERKLFLPFLNQFPDNTPKHIVINKKNKGDCCGCGACEAACPKKAITMRTDSEGFWYPQVDSSLCVDCGLCKKACTFNAEWGGIRELCADHPMAVYGVKHKDEPTRAASRSGGIFTALSDQILHQGGTVYGVALDERFLAEHRRAVTAEERNQFRGSKYIQSRMDGIYSQIREDLRAGKNVLFSGTPCQVAAVRKAMKKENTEKLFLVDIICHGVPTPKVWRDYLDAMEDKHQGKVTAVDFRNKKFGWTAHKETFVINGCEYESEFFRTLFGSHEIIRPSCYYCKYKKIIRVGDITIGDYWGIDKAIPKFNDEKGVSLILINNEKGMRLFELCKTNIVCKEAQLRDSMQNCLRICYGSPANRKEFWQSYKRSGIKGCMSAMQKQNRIQGMKNLKRRGIHLAKRVIKKVVRM